MKTTNLIALGVLVIIVVGAFFFFRESDLPDSYPDAAGEPFTGVEGDPTDIAIDFYRDWQRATIATNTTPYETSLIDEAPLSVALRERLIASEGGTDPVICQSVVPGSVRSKSIYLNDTGAQLMILAQQQGNAGQTIVTLEGQDGQWRISDISCGAGEAAPNQGEFNFDRTGFLLRESVPDPLDSSTWHLVFEQNGVLGHTAPLFFDGESVCTGTEGADAACDPNELREALEVRVQGNMAETGVKVERLEVME